MKRTLWRSLLEEYYRLYSSVEITGSDSIAQHQKEVLTRMEVGFDQFNLQTREPAVKPVCDYLPEIITRSSYPSVVDLIDSLQSNLTWEYGYDELPEELAEKYAYAEIMSPQGPIINSDLTLGLVLLGPNCTYPQHSHADIAESYICISGQVIVNDRGVFPPGGLIYNSPGELHELSTASNGCLLLYAWVAEEEILVENTMEFD
ncbi:dimethylsulfonioproprionate lyase family protein [Halanaerobaculum tunisiense]